MFTNKKLFFPKFKMEDDTKEMPGKMEKHK